MSVENVSQALFLTSQSDGANISVSQSFLLATQGPPNTPSNNTQSLLLAAVANNRGVFTLKNVYSLPCYQPCTTYGTHATIIVIG